MAAGRTLIASILFGALLVAPSVGLATPYADHFDVDTTANYTGAGTIGTGTFAIDTFAGTLLVVAAADATFAVATNTALLESGESFSVSVPDPGSDRAYAFVSTVPGQATGGASNGFRVVRAVGLLQLEQMAGLNFGNDLHIQADPAPGVPLVVTLARLETGSVLLRAQGAAIGAFSVVDGGMGALHVGVAVGSQGAQAVAMFDDLVVAALPDGDADGLVDDRETYLTGTDPGDADSDDDGLDDGVEVLVHGTAPLDSDSDDDGLSDGDEVNLYDTDPLVDEDSDSDGLSDAQEILIHGTDWLNPDTDEDGLSDGDEVAAGSNPLIASTTLSYSGVITQVDDPGGLLDPQVLLDATFTLHVTFDADSPLEVPEQIPGTYYLPNGGITQTIWFGGAPIVDGTSDLIAIGDDFTDQPYGLRDFWGISRSNLPAATLFLQTGYLDYTTTVLSNESFFVPSHSDFTGWQEVSVFFGYVESPESVLLLAVGTLSPSAPVALPSLGGGAARVLAVALIASSLFALRRRRPRRSSDSWSVSSRLNSEPSTRSRWKTVATFSPNP